MSRLHKKIKKIAIAIILFIVAGLILNHTFSGDLGEKLTSFLAISGHLMIGLIVGFMVANRLSLTDSEPTAEEASGNNKHQDPDDLSTNAYRLESILRASSGVAIMATDLDGTFTLFNSGAENVSGYSAEELVGKSNPEHLFDEKSLKVFQEAQEYILKRPVKRGRLFAAETMPYFTGEVEALCRKKDGEKFYLSLNFSPIVDENNETIGSLCIATDISDRKKAERALHESEKKYRMIADSINDIIWIRDIDTFEVKYQSPACKRILGYTPEEIVNIDLNDLIMPDSISELVRIAREELEREKTPGQSSSKNRIFELEHIRKDGSTVWLEIQANFIRDKAGKPTDFIGVSRDVTERKAFEKQLQAAKKKAESANIAKSEFLANMSHEIRTPMNAIIGMSELIMSTDMNRKQRDFLKIIRTSSRVLLSLINDILDFSKIEAGKLELEEIPVVLADIIEEIPDIFVENIMESDIEVVLNIAQATPDCIVSDPVRLRQILVNLVSNAFKFTSKGQIDISVKPQTLTDDSAVLLFCVKDTGIGFDTTVEAKLFNAFSQADGSTTRKYGGTGLGLTICRKLVEMMGGGIWAESEIGSGSSFYFTISVPIAKDMAGHDFSLQPSLKDKKVLIADDNPATREIMSLYVTSFGFKVETAENAPSAIEMYKAAKDEAPYELIIIDIKMPGMDGVTACEKILDDAGKNRPSIIIMSSTYDQENIKRMQEAGVTSFIMKPIKKSSLYNAIREQFGFQPTLLKNFFEEISSPDEFSAITVLLVEDNAINQLVASEILMAVNINVIKAGTGLEAIDILKHKTVDAVLMDVQMPEMDGLEATRIIRSGLELDVPIIAMTANAMQGDREACLEAGMDDYLAKPIDSKKLFHLLKANIKRVNETSAETDVKTVEAVPNVLPGINIREALDRVGGNEKLFSRVLIDFKQNHFDEAEKIISALEKKDHELAGRLCHSIKGVAGNFSAPELKMAAENLELAIEKGELLDELIKTFKAALLEVVASAGMLEKTMAEETIIRRNKAISLQDLDPLLRRLLIHLKQRDIKKTETCMEKIKELLNGSRLHEESVSLSTDIDNMEYDNALITLSVISEKTGINLSEA